MMNKVLANTIVVILGCAASSGVYANARGIAVITGCGPAGGVTAYCGVRKDVADPQNWHTKQCELKEDGQKVIGGDFLSDAHGLNESVAHDFPTPAFSRTWQECVLFTVVNYSAWWTGHPYSYGNLKSAFAEDDAGGPNSRSCQ